MRFIGSEPTEGQPVQFLGIYALAWPWDNGAEPTMAFVEDDSPSVADALATIHRSAFCAEPDGPLTAEELGAKIRQACRTCQAVAVTAWRGSAE